MKREDKFESSDLDKDQFPLVNNGTLAADLQMAVVDPSLEEKGKAKKVLFIIT